MQFCLPIAAGTAVGFGTQPRRVTKSYAEMEQPPLKPPAWVFGPVWTTLYGLMGYASHRAWTIGMSNSALPSTVENARVGATLYTLQLGLNLIWMPLFFGIGRPIEATADIVALTGTVGYLAYLWSSIDETAAWCMVPYLGWLSFATYLSAATGYLNNWDLSKHSTMTKKEQ